MGNSHNTTFQQKFENVCRFESDGLFSRTSQYDKDTKQKKNKVIHGGVKFVRCHAKEK